MAPRSIDLQKFYAHHTTPKLTVHFHQTYEELERFYKTVTTRHMTMKFRFPKRDNYLQSAEAKRSFERGLERLFVALYEAEPNMVLEFAGIDTEK